MYKEMIYSVKDKREILKSGFCFGILFYILNLGLHPTAYVKIPKDYQINIYDIDVHGGITYEKDYLYVENNQKIEGHFIGWDYAHYGDYAGYEEKLPKQYRVGGKKWTTEEILEDVKKVCYQVQYSKRGD